MKSLTLISLFLLVSSSLARQKAGCDDDLIRGVNLGGWLLLEPWITPIFFEAVNVGELQVIRREKCQSTGCLKKTPHKEMFDFLTLKMLPVALVLIKPEKCHLLAPLVKKNCSDH